MFAFLIYVLCFRFKCWVWIVSVFDFMFGMGWISGSIFGIDMFVFKFIFGF